MPETRKELVSLLEERVAELEALAGKKVCSITELSMVMQGCSIPPNSSQPRDTTSFAKVESIRGFSLREIVDKLKAEITPG